MLANRSRIDSVKITISRKSETVKGIRGRASTFITQQGGQLTLGYIKNEKFSFVVCWQLQKFSAGR